jgi:hypothetical protein
MSTEMSEITDPSILEITDQLGEPDAIYRASVPKMASRIIVGGLGLGLTLTIAILLISGTIPWPAAKHIKLWGFLLFGGITIPIASLTSINFALACRGMWVLCYPTGLFIRRKKEVIALPWDEIQTVQFENFPDNAHLQIIYKVPNATKSYSPQERLDLVDTAYVELKKSSTMGCSLTLLRADTKGATVSSMLTGFPELAKTIQIETFRRWYPKIIDQLKNHQAILLGDFVITLEGITHQSTTLAWRDFKELKRKQKLYTITQKKKWGAWLKILSVAVPNWHLFETLVQVLTDYHKLPDERDDYNEQSD